ncbi:MAG: hypothetical protein EBE86_019620 [Hormoscilla sp. GUM202]|nr:hypothetical protein [Hormoscilla sp. GUM202]
MEKETRFAELAARSGHRTRDPNRVSTRIMYGAVDRVKKPGFWLPRDRPTVPEGETGFYDNYPWCPRLEKETRFLVTERSAHGPRGRMI